jgi:hypothetical protein
MVGLRAAILLGAALLPGCALVDQTTFNPEAGKRPVIPSAPAPVAARPPEPGPPPLLTISLPQAGDVRAELARAVAAARARKPDVVFDVVETTGAEPLATVGREAAAVARLIVAQGVPASRVRLIARPAPEAGREVRVYVH